MNERTLGTVIADGLMVVVTIVLVAVIILTYQHNRIEHQTVEVSYEWSNQSYTDTICLSDTMFVSAVGYHSTIPSHIKPIIEEAISNYYSPVDNGSTAKYDSITDIPSEPQMIISKPELP